MRAVAEYPGGLSEREFLQAYHRSTLRLPQVASDSLLRSMVTAAEADRPALLAALGLMAGLAARLLTAVCLALSERTRPVAMQLLRPLPGADAWRELLQRVSTRAPAVVAGDLGLSPEGIAYAERLRSLGDLTWLTPLVAVSERHGFLVAPVSQWRPAGDVWPVADDAVSPSVVLRDQDAATAADTTAELVAVARGFLGVYLEGLPGMTER